MREAALASAKEQPAGHDVKSHDVKPHGVKSHGVKSGGDGHGEGASTRRDFLMVAAGSWAAVGAAASRSMVPVFWGISG